MSVYSAGGTEKFRGMKEGKVTIKGTCTHGWKGSPENSFDNSTKSASMGYIK